MRFHRLLICSIALSGLVLARPTFSSAQKLQERYDDIYSFLREKKDLVPGYFFDSLAGTFQDNVSGTSVKDGKLIGTSLSIEETGATANIGIKTLEVWGLDIYSAVKISGRGDNQFISLLEDSKYKQTISAGGVLNIFSRGFHAYYDCLEKAVVHRKMQPLYANYRNNTNAAEIDLQANYLLQAKKRLAAYYEQYTRYRGMNCEEKCDSVLIATLPTSYLKVMEDGEAAIDTLKKLGLLKKDFELESCGEEDKAGATISRLFRSVDSLKIRLALQRFVSESEKVFGKASWNAGSLWWLTFSGSYNIAPQQIIDPSLKNDHYLYNFNNEYAKFSLAYNFLYALNNPSQFQLIVSPTYSISTQRSFSDDDKITLSKLNSYPAITGDTVSKSEFSSTGFEQIARRANVWSVELPFSFFWNRSNLGIDFALRAGGNDPKGDNVGGRLGVYIPLDIKEGAPVWIEPLVRVGKLFERSDSKFFKDNVTVGFNLSVAINKVVFRDGKKDKE